jgi:hypothetical protein
MFSNVVYTIVYDDHIYSTIFLTHSSSIGSQRIFPTQEKVYSHMSYTGYASTVSTDSPLIFYNLVEFV